LDYLLLKWIHILSSAVLFGTGFGSAFYMFMANYRNELPSICFATRHVVIADWIFTTPAVVIQLLTGLCLVYLQGYALTTRWIAAALALYFLVGACWIPVVIMQIRMRDMAKAAFEAHTDLPALYWKMNRWWTALGCVALVNPLN
jgi:uncharacterized membrane protein